MRARFAVPLVVAVFAGAATAAFPAADGKALYQTKCAMCHGTDGVAKSMAQGSRSFNDAEFQKAVSAEEIARVIEQGKNKMPANKGRLSPEQIQAIAAHVKTMAEPPK